MASVLDGLEMAWKVPSWDPAIPRGRVRLPYRDGDCTIYTSFLPCRGCSGYIRRCRSDSGTGLVVITCYGCGRVHIKPGAN